MTVKLKKWDSAEHLDSEEAIANYWEACLEEASDDAAFITVVLGNIARARGMTELAKQVGMSREGLYKALSGEGNPSFANVLKIVSALGLSLRTGPQIQQQTA